MMMPGNRMLVRSAKTGTPRKLIRAWPASVATAAPQLKVSTFQTVAAVEAVAEASTPATPKAISAVIIIIWPMDIRPPNGSVQMVVVGRM